MEKEIRISMRIDKELKQAFFEVCERKQQIPSKVIKHLIATYVRNNKEVLEGDYEYVG